MVEPRPKGTSQGDGTVFMSSYLNNFDYNKSLSLENFEEIQQSYEDKRNVVPNSKHWPEQHWSEQIKSNSGLRKVYDSYLDIVRGNKINEKAINIDIRFAKIGYQEKRALLPDGFLKFLQGIYVKVEKDQTKFKNFLEVFIAYHKYFNPNAK